MALNGGTLKEPRQKQSSSLRDNGPSWRDYILPSEASYVMIYLTIIPFFLVGRIFESSTSQWPNTRAVQSTFLTSLNVSITSEGEYDKESKFHWAYSAEMKCRPQGYSTRTLLCHIGEIRTCEGPPEEEFKLSEPFSVVFDKQGVQSVLVDENISQWKSLIVKAFIAQLNVGFDIYQCLFPEIEKWIRGDIATSRCETVERSTAGKCNVKIDITLDKNATTNVTKIREKEISLELEGMPMPKPRFKIEIAKLRNQTTCDNKPGFYFLPNDMDDVPYKMNTWTSKIVAANGDDGFSFKSVSETRGKLTNMKKMKPYSIYEMVSIELLSVEPAEDEIPFDTNNKKNIFGDEAPAKNEV